MSLITRKNEGGLIKRSTTRKPTHRSSSRQKQIEQEILAGTDSCYIKIGDEQVFVSAMEKRKIEKSAARKKEQTTLKRQRTRKINKDEASSKKIGAELELTLDHVKFMSDEGIRKSVFAMMEKCYGKFELKIKDPSKGWIEVSVDKYLEWNGHKLIGKTRVVGDKKKSASNWMRKLLTNVELLEGENLQRYIINVYFQKVGLYVR